MDRTSLTFKTLRNISFNLTSYVWPIVFSVFVTPVIVFGLGVKDYGIYIFINTVTGLLTILDLGVTTATIKYLSQYIGSKEEERMKNLLYSMNTIFFLIGCAGFIITILFSFFANRFLPDIIVREQYYLIIFIIAGFSFLISSISNFYSIIPYVTQRFDVSSIINIVFVTISSLANLILILLGYRLMAIFIAQAIISLISLLIRRQIATNLLPWINYRFMLVKEEIIKCYKLGLAYVFNNISNMSLSSLDRLIIPLFIGPTQLSYYSLPGNIAMRIPGVADNISGVFFPLTSSLQGNNDAKKIERVYIRSMRLMIIVSAAISFAIIFMSHSILQYWLNLSFAIQSSKILVILAITAFIISLLSPVNSLLFGLGKLKLLSIVSFFMAIINAISLFLLLPDFGIEGAAWAYFFSVLPIFFIIYRVEKYYLNLTSRLTFYFNSAIKLSLTASAFYLVCIFLILPLVVNKMTLVIMGPIAVVSYLAIYQIFGFYEPEDWKDIKKFFLLISLRIARIFKTDRNRREKQKQDIKMFIRGLLPRWFLNLIRRQQVPLRKMLEFTIEHKPLPNNLTIELKTLAIIVPCYNHDKYLAKTFESIINQTHLPNQVILINDDSKDRTGELIKKLVANYEANDPGKIKFITDNNNHNLGQAMTINKAIKLASTDLIMILNDDDYLMHDAVETILHLFRQNPKLALIGGSNIKFSNDELLDSSNKLIKNIKNPAEIELSITTPEDALKFEDFCCLNITHTGSTFVKTKAISAGLYREKKDRIIRFTDRDFQIRVNLLYPIGTTGDKIPFCFWRADSSVDAGLNS